MTFIWPKMLWLLLMLPLLVAAYLVVRLRQKKAVLKYANLGMANAAVNATVRIQRQVPPILILLALVATMIALARPAALVTLPSQHQTIIVAIDNSGSMSAKDVKPDRFASARSAARAFVADQPMHTRIGVVAFAGAASVVQSPTENREDILAAIDRLQIQPGTAVGSAILASLKAIFPQGQFDISTTNTERGASRDNKSGALKDRSDAENTSAKEPVEVVAPGSYTSAAVILFTDGQTTTGPDPLEAARIAADRGVRIYTVGIGSAQGEVISIDGWSMRVRVDEDTLKTIAASTRGEYFYGGTTNEVKQVYQHLNSRLSWEKRESEITALFTGAGGLLALIGGFLSLLWFNRIL